MRLRKSVRIKENTLLLKYMMDWYMKGRKILNIVTIPYTNIKFFCHVIEEVLSNNGKVLYVWGKKEVNSKIVRLLRENNKNLSVDYYRRNIEKDLTFIDFSHADNIKGHFDLIIVDDISTFSEMNREQLNLFLDKLKEKAKKIVIASIEKISRGEVLEIIDLDNKKPFIEPRFIFTRVDLKVDIPFSLYEYLKWFNKLERNVFIIAPPKEDVVNLNMYYNGQLKKSNITTQLIKEPQDINRIVNRVSMGYKGNFVITNIIGDYLSSIKNLSVIVLFNEENSFIYKKIVYLCANIYKSNNQLGELIIVSNELNEEMEKVKNISRRFNELVWEKGVFTI